MTSSSCATTKAQIAKNLLGESAWGNTWVISSESSTSHLSGSAIVPSIGAGGGVSSGTSSFSSSGMTSGVEEAVSGVVVASSAYVYTKRSARRTSEPANIFFIELLLITINNLFHTSTRLCRRGRTATKI